MSVELDSRAQLRAGQVVGNPDGGPAFVVLVAPMRRGVLTCEGVPVRACPPVACALAAGAGAVRDSAAPAIRAGTQLRDETSGLVLSCVRPGDGVLRFDGRALFVQERGGWRRAVWANGRRRRCE